MLAEHAPVTPYVRSHVEGKAWARDLAWDQLAAIGATGLLVADAHGGLGLGTIDAVLVAEAAGAALYPGPWLASAVGAARALDGTTHAAGTQLLDGVAAGTTIATVAVDGAF